MQRAQWQQTNGSGGGTGYSLAVSGTNLFAGTLGGGVFLSTNNGSSWTAVNAGLTNTSVQSLAVSPNGAGGTNLFAPGLLAASFYRPTTAQAGQQSTQA